MDTPIATPNNENLPGVPFFERDMPNLGGDEPTLFSATFSTESMNLLNESMDFAGDPWIVRWVKTTGSTNADLVQAALQNAPNRLVLVADHQSAGRGRLNRTWEAPHGANLLMSVLIRSVPAFPHQLTQAVAVAAAETCEAVAAKTGCHLQVDLKWPNDVLIRGRKVAGILANAGSLPVGSGPEGQPGPDFVVVGLGLNIAWAPEGAVSLIEALEVDLGRSGAGMRDELLAGILERLNGLLGASAEVVYERYRNKLSTLGREVQVHLPTGEILEGQVLDVETDGRLVVLDTGAVTHRLDVGDIVHLR